MYIYNSYRMWVFGGELAYIHIYVRMEGRRDLDFSPRRLSAALADQRRYAAEAIAAKVSE